ncbi:MAG: transcription-repair coupling factor [Phascolarctobacterium sp.]|nr:transcription-repair coupling factor [Phascolarctobacterium sp.]
MNNLLINRLVEVKELKQAVESFKKKTTTILTGLGEASKSVFCVAINEALALNGSICIITATREEMRIYRRELAYLYPDLPTQELYPENLPRIQAETQSLEVTAGRVRALKFLQGEEQGIVFVTAEALEQKQLRPTEDISQKIKLSLGEEIDQRAFMEKLLALGYERTEQVDAIGQFSQRGDILDVYPINMNNPVRVEWFDTEIDALRTFDIDSQRSKETLDELSIASIVVYDTEEYSASIFDYCVENTLVIVDEPVRLVSMLDKYEKENKDFAQDIFTSAELTEFMKNSGVFLVSALSHSILKEQLAINIPVRNVSQYNKNIEMITEDLKNYLADGVTPILMMSSSIKARGFADNLHNYGLEGVYVDEELQPGYVNVMYGDLGHGFRFWSENWVFITENDLFGHQKKKRLHSKHQGQQLQYFSDIKVGDYVVHRVHGIGRYVGVENVLVGGMHRDYLLLHYAGDDKLYVPVEQVGMLHKYIGNDGSVPRLSKMGGKDWKRTTDKAAKAITILAEELLRLYAQRQITPGHAFSKDTSFQKEFEEAFPYEETADQLQAIAEIKADMEKPQPMERLLCGDVGYGKTEVALRAAFKAVMDGKQVAVMVPTTVLAQQHFLTFKERMRNFGPNVAMINRFCSAKEQKQILRDLADSRIDILIGTHRLLQDDVVFPNLGLLIIDEEQRFGVAQKEKIKKWRTGIDVLSLSATPIPRTLHMALVSSRDMSVIEYPPEDRLPVETYVTEYDDGMVKEAIERELRRGGRVYYIRNRVDGLEAVSRKLKSLIPGLNVRIAHGQMQEQLLEDAMIEFYEGDCDVLLCTTIVENGLDVPLANTIIIDGADTFGLSQLYQMRGRVGRSSRLAYAYLLYKPNKALSEIAEKRLSAIRDFTELGSGFKIAMRDLEIRGAGNLLGKEQHGHITGIGFAAYCEMLEATIKLLKEGKRSALEPDPIVEAPLDAYIPDDYIDNPRYKMELYRRCASMEFAEKDDLLDEIVDRFGNPPDEVVNLWRVAGIRALCRLIGIRSLTIRQGMIRMVFEEKALVKVDILGKEIDNSQGRMSCTWGKEPVFTYRTTSLKLDQVDWVEKFLPRIALANKYKIK